MGRRDQFVIFFSQVILTCKFLIIFEIGEELYFLLHRNIELYCKLVFLNLFDVSKLSFS